MHKILFNIYLLWWTLASYQKPCTETLFIHRNLYFKIYQQWTKRPTRLRACVRARGGHFEHTLNNGAILRKQSNDILIRVDTCSSDDW